MHGQQNIKKCIYYLYNGKHTAQVLKVLITCCAYVLELDPRETSVGFLGSGIHANEAVNCHAEDNLLI
jgi:hypothetical protein